MIKLCTNLTDLDMSEKIRTNGAPDIVGDDDDDTEKEGVSLSPDLQWEDKLLHSHTLDALNQMRKNKHFCDIILQINKEDLYAHRVVLAAVSPYFMDILNSANDAPTRKEIEGRNGIIYEMNGGFDKAAVEKLLEYAYTGRLNICGDQVKSVYVSSVKMKMDRIARKCAQHLTENMNIENCLELRALPGVSKLNGLVEKVDTFIEDQIDDICKSKKFLTVNRICLEILHNTKEEQEWAQSTSLCQLVLDWIHSQWLENKELTLKQLTEKTHLLYLGDNNALHDCQEIQTGAPNDSDIIRDYKKFNQSNTAVQTKKVRRHSQMKPSKPRELMFSRHLNQEDVKIEDNPTDWKVIGCSIIEGSTIIGIITVDGQLVTCSIVKRLNRPSTSTSLNLSTSAALMSCLSMTDSFSTVRASNGKNGPRPPSADKDLFVPVASMDQPRCAGTTSIRGSLVVCGGFDRGECLDSVCVYNERTNEWSDLKPMLNKRGRFDVTVKGDCIYAVAGSNGNAETNTAEKYDCAKEKWSFIANLPVPVSNIGLCNLNDRIYSIGGTYGQSGNKHCYRLAEDESKWERIASLLTGRSQAGVASFEGRIWVVGGCDAWNPLSSTEVYDPETNSWNLGPPMNSPRRGCGLIAFDGLLYVVGGSDGTQSLCTTEIYDPKVNLWVAGPNMTTCRGNVSVAVVDNKLWAVGGFSGKKFLNTIEFYNPELLEWTNFLTNKGKVNNNSDNDEQKQKPKEASENGTEQEINENTGDLVKTRSNDDESEADNNVNSTIDPVCGN